VAIDFISVNIVSAGRGERAFGLGAYLCRERWQDPLTRRIFDFSKHAGDLLHAEVLLPDGATPALHAPESFVTAVEAAELVIVRKTRERRFRRNGQLVKHVILALPRELNARQRLALAREWAQTQYVDQGAGVLLVVHEADDPEIGNYHAHLLVTTREVGPAGLSRRKSRHLNPEFSRAAGHERATLHKDDLPGQWRSFQNAFFRRHDIPLSVDPSFIVAGQHRGKGGFVPGSDVSATDDAAQQEARRRIRETPHLLEFVTRHAATFTRRSLRAALQKHEVPRHEIATLIETALADPEVVPLIDPATGRPGRLFTTLTVRAQEGRILDLAHRIAARQAPADRRRALASAAAARATVLGLSDEQKAALLHCVTGANFFCVRGVAGAGKSYTVKGIREALEASGYRVVGLAPTNKVACAMAVDGFGYAATLHRESLRQKSARYADQRWDENTCVIVDEAGMVDSAMLEELLERVDATGAKVVLVGDQAQLASVARGGMFGVLKDQLGCAEIREIRRQAEDWARAASLDFAEGNIDAGLDAYAERGHLRWSETLGDATDALVRQWQRDFQAAPNVERFVYAATNASVDKLNDALQAARWQGAAPNFVSFATKRGRVALTVGDRIQIYGNLPKDGIYNGMIGTVAEATPDRIRFLADGGKELSFTPEDFGDFGLGYAGTVYRGQGQTLPQTYALYDSPFSWNRRTTYVALTRHKQAVSLFVPRTLAADAQTLARQMARDDGSDPSICFEPAMMPAQSVSSPSMANSTTLVAVAPKTATTLVPQSQIVVPAPVPGNPTPAREHLPAPGPTPPSMAVTQPAPPLPDGILPAMSTPGSMGSRGASGHGQVSGGSQVPIPFAVTFSSGTATFDLALAADRGHLRDRLFQEPRAEIMARVVAVYAQLRALQRRYPGAGHDLQGLRASLTTDGKTHGFLPKENKIWADCLMHTRLDPRNILSDPELWHPKGEVNIRPLVQDLYEVDPGVSAVLERRLLQLVPECWRAIDNSLRNATGRARDSFSEHLELAIVNTRAWLYRIAHRVGIDLHPELTQELGRRVPPDEYVDAYLVLGRKAERAAPPPDLNEPMPMTTGRTGESTPAPQTDDAHRLALEQRKANLAQRNAYLTRAFERRLEDQIRERQEKLAALEERHPTSFLQEHAVFTERKEHIEQIGVLQTRLDDFRRAPGTVLQRAKPIDFLPSCITEQELARTPGRTRYDGGPDAATRMLEDILELFWREPRRISPAGKTEPGRPRATTDGSSAGSAAAISQPGIPAPITTAAPEHDKPMPSPAPPSSPPSPAAPAMPPRHARDEGIEF
jgi:Ti-type conjugative transfer relaxase TraA